MSTKKVNADLENGCDISELKIRRNQGKLNPDVIDFCTKHLDLMVEHLRTCNAHVNLNPSNGPSLDDAVAYLKADPQKLLLVSSFMDDYEEVLKWNNNKLIPFSATVSHREVDIAMFHTICEWDDCKWAAMISKILYRYGHRNA